MRLGVSFPSRFALAATRAGVLFFFVLLQWQVALAASEAGAAHDNSKHSAQGLHLQNCSAPDAPDAPAQQRCEHLYCCAHSAEDDASITRGIIGAVFTLPAVYEGETAPKHSTQASLPTSGRRFLSAGSPRSPPAGA